MRAWSFSALNSFETCPRRYYEVSVTKNFAEAPSEALEYGSKVHKAFEAYLDADASLPTFLSRYKPLLDSYKKYKGLADVFDVERKVALNQKLEETRFFGKDVWVRSVFDLVVKINDRVLVVDWKTGKRKEHALQSDLFAAMASIVYGAKSVMTHFVWIAEAKDYLFGGIVSERKYGADTGDVWTELKPRVDAFQAAFDTNTFDPKPSGLCRKHCPVSTCPYHGG